MDSELVKSIKDGMSGKNRGIPGGLPRFDRETYNIQPAKMISVVGSSKAGKTAFALWRYIFIPWINGERNIKWIYYSLEVDIEQIKARLIAMFVYKLHGIKINPNKVYSLGEERLSQYEADLIISIEKNHLIPLFNRIEFIADKADANPTAIYKHAVAYANKNGETLYQKFNTMDDRGQAVERERVIGYRNDKPEEKVFIIIDTLGLMKKEKGMNKKDNMDKWLEDYAVTLRNIYKYTIINLHHLNRGMSAVDRLKFADQDLQPQLDDIKDTSGIGECSDMVIAVFNPNVYKHLTEHQDHNLLEHNGKYRSIHVLASRYTASPINGALTFDYETGLWNELPPVIKKNKELEFKLVK